MTDSTIRVEAPGKLVLLGEYAVLEKAPALVASVNKRCNVQLTSRLNPGFKIEAENLNLPPVEFALDEEGNYEFDNNTHSSVRSQLNFALSLLKYVSRKIGKKVPPIDIRIDTAEFFHKLSGRKLGLGSSAALTVALLSAIEKFTESAGWMKNLFREALNAHRNAQDKMGSGVDIAASTLGGILEYRMPDHEKGAEASIKTADWPDDLYMASIWTGHSVSTRSLIRKVHTFRDSSPSLYKTLMKEMSALSVEGCEAFRMGNTEGFLKVVSEFVERERMLSKYSNADIISDVHEQISNLIELAGGYYKPSGAGGGDIGVAFCRTEQTYNRIIEVIEASPFEVLDLAIQTEGVKPILPYEVN